MDFRTILQISQNISSDFPQINHKMPILSIGSCFADMISAKLAFYKFRVIASPFGIIFNPISINKLLKLSLKNAFSDDLSNNFDDNFDKSFDENFIKNQENIWYHYDFHSDLYGNTKNEIKQKINTKIQQTKAFFGENLTKNSTENTPQNTLKTLILTFGTAFVYVENQNNQVVANCHKIPQKNFTKKMLSVDEIVADFDEIYPQLSEKNTQIILTVSPVRHIKDTFALNAVSKSILRVAAHILSEKYEKVYYFPSFEIMNDDLRDYRFYKADMLHPSTQAEDYIWEKFVQATMSAPTQAIMQVFEDLSKSISHKNTASNLSEKHDKFLQKTLFELENLAQTLAEEIDLKEEIEKLRNRIALNS